MRSLWLFVCFPIVWGHVATKRDSAPDFCVEGLEKFFLCADVDRCINKRAVCDGHTDCPDNSDEANCACRRNKDCPKDVKCQKDLDAATSACLNCGPGQRFVKSQCEDIDECTDQAICAGRGSCVNRPNGFECVECPLGYEADLRNFRLFMDNAALNASETFRKLLLCDDHNECEEGNPCSDGVCFNRIGGHSCECPPNHERRSDIRENVCQAVGEQPLMAIGNDSAILVFDLRSATPAQELKWVERIVDLSADKEVVVFATRQQIWKYQIATESTLILADFESVDEFSKSDIKKIAADWENHRVYVLTGDSVSVIDVAGRAVKIIEHRGNISSIAVDPLAGYLFYSEFGHVRRTRLDALAESTTTIFSALPVGDLHNIEVLAIDPNLHYVYYIHNRVLYSFDYEGHRALIMSGSADYTRLEPFEDRLYATYRVVDSDTVVTLGRAGYSTGRPLESRVESFRGTLPKSFAIIQRAKFPTRQNDSSNGCSKKPCESDWCFPMPQSREPSYNCVCAPEQRNNCIPWKIHRLQPLTNDILPNEEQMSVRDSSVPTSARISSVGIIIIIPTFIVLLNSLIYFK